MTRSELYALVWAEPVHTLAARLGLSGAGLAKLCDRHAIPIPARGYWQRLAAGQDVGPAPLPEHAADEVIPRFRLLDASGAPVEQGEWLIPGVLRRPVQDPATTPGSTPRPPPTPGKGRGAGGTLGGTLVSAQESAWPTSAPTGGGAPAGSGPPEIVDPAGAKPVEAAPRRCAPAPPERHETRPSPPAAATSSTADFAQAPPAGFDAGAALDAELERALVVAAEVQRRKAVHQLLAAVAVRATTEPSAHAKPMLAWIAAVRWRLEQDDPVGRLIASLRDT